MNYSDIMAEQNLSVIDETGVDESEVSTLTLNEVLQYEDQIIEDTAAVLGALNDKNCSYAEGYVKRQALYSCLTCIPEGKNDPEKRAGICLACSYHCHDGHELIELYTKRNFRCDCGNSKFDSFQCNILEDKDPLNENNIYNQNFQGTYCVCSRPYPDPEDSVSDEMIQCIVCEDWYHTRHLNISLPVNSFVEMACFNCVGDHQFLLHYKEASVEESEPCVSVDNEEDIAVSDDQCHQESSENKEEILLENIDPLQMENDMDGECKKPKTTSHVSTLFWSDISWRNRLCKCDICLEMYEDENVLYLIDSEDPVQIYEEKGKAKTQEVIENQDRDFLSSMNRVQLMETIAGYNELKTGLADFFKDFAEKRKVIKEEDVREFFEEMQAKKKRRTEMPYFCH
ncbi:hypothetical protein WA026_012416 [Henosepilachna vigintioctopunctata]|uniref:UBR-type domain-containing protein n=1 Tax=Henosepilachna vigintioctopunctata TaxID=420089 RepID=A0AAW1UYU4_9CUCU